MPRRKRKTLEKRDRIIRILEHYGPMTRKELRRRLRRRESNISKYIAMLRPERIEIFRLTVGRRGGRKYGGSSLYGELSKCGQIIALKDDPRIIAYIAERLPPIENRPHKLSLFRNLKERARALPQVRG